MNCNPDKLANRKTNISTQASLQLKLKNEIPCHSEFFHLLPPITPNYSHLARKICLIRIKVLLEISNSETVIGKKWKGSNHTSCIFFFYLDAPNAVHVKYNCLVSNGIKKGHLLVSCSHQSGKAPLASANGSCSLMQGIKHVWNNSKIKNGKKPNNFQQSR